MKPNHLINLDPSLRQRAPNVFAERQPTTRELTDMLNEFNKTFAAFREDNDKRLSDIEKGREDGVQNEKVDRINDELTKFQAAIDELSQRMAAAQIGAGGGNQVTAEVHAHSDAFHGYIRNGRGTAQEVNDLAVSASLTTSSDPDGGAVVPTSVDQNISRILGVHSVMRGLAQTITISTDEHKKLVNLGGTGSGWVGENEERPETSGMNLAGLKFPAMELYAMPAATQKLLDDSTVDIESWLAEEVVTAFAEQEGAAFINGDGVKQPRGLLSYDTVENDSYAWGKVGYKLTGVNGGFAASTPADALLDMIYSLKAGYRNNASWLMNTLTIAAVRKFKDGDGNYLWQPSAQIGEPATLLGYGLHDDDNMPVVATNALGLAFGDFQRAYLVIDRIGVRVLRDPFTKKPYVLFYTTKRVGGGIQNFEAIKLLKFGTS